MREGHAREVKARLALVDAAWRAKDEARAAEVRRAVVAIGGATTRAERSALEVSRREADVVVSRRARAPRARAVSPDIGGGVAAR